MPGTSYGCSCARRSIGAGLEPLGVRDVEHVVGDATDAESVRRAMDGCDAVVHAAAIFSYDARDARAMQQGNTRATEVVLDAARVGGLDPIVHVSSYVALLPPAEVLDGDCRSVRLAASTRVRRPRPSRWRGSSRMRARQS